MSKIGNIYVEIRGDYTKYKEDIQALKVTAKVDGAKVSDALNNAITPTKASQAINQLNADLRQLSGAAKVPADNFKATADAISRDLGKIATAAGLTEKEFSALTEKMLQTQAQKATERSFNDVAKAAGLSQAELNVLGKQLGFSTEQMGKLGISLGGANKDMTAQESILGNLHKNWVGFSIGINQAMEVIGKIYRFTQAVVDFGEAGAEVERVERSFAAVASAAGLNGEAVVRAFKGAAQGLMDESDLMAKASRLIQENIPVDVIENLIRALAKQAPIVGETLPQAYEKFSDALITGNMKTVKLYTGTVELDDIYEKYAKSIGVTKEELSGEAKVKIRAIELTDLLTKKTEGLDGSYEGASEKIQKAKVSINDLKEQMQKEAIPITLLYYEALTKLLKAFNDLSNRPAPEWVLRQKYGSKGSGASGSWGPSGNYTMDDATVNMRPLELPLNKVEDDGKKAADKLKKIWDDYIQHLGKTESEAFDKWGKDEKERLEESNKAFKKLSDDEVSALENTFKVAGETFENRTKKDKEELDKMSRDEEFALNHMFNVYGKLPDEWKKNADKRWEIERKLNQDIAKFAGDDFDVRRKNLDDQARIYKEFGVNVDTVNRWLAIEKQKLLEEELLEYGTFWDGVNVQYSKNLREQTTWAQQGAAIWNGVFGKGGALEGTLNTFFDDLFAGELKTAEDYFKSFTDAILKMFAQMIAQMVAQWAASKIGEFFDLGTGGKTTGGGVNIGGNAGGGIVNSAVSTGVSAGIDYLAGTTGGATGLASSLWSFGSWGGPGSGLSSAGAGGAGAGGAGAMGAAGAAGVGAGFAAVLAIWAMGIKKGKEQIYGLNPFANEYGPAVVASDKTMQMSAGDINQLDWYKNNLPSVEEYGKRWAAETGKLPPTSDKMLKGEASRYLNWMDSQPEMETARRKYVDWFNQNYLWNGPSGEGTTGYWEKLGKHQASDTFSYSTAANGALIDEPMMAYGKSGKRILMGEAGPEYIVPAGKGQMVHLSLSLDSRVIGEAIYDLSKRGQKVVHQRGVTAN